MCVCAEMLQLPVMVSCPVGCHSSSHHSNGHHHVSEPASSALHQQVNSPVSHSLVYQSIYLFVSLTVCHCSHSNKGGVSSPSPVILTNPKESGALVSISRITDGEPINIFLDPNCPDYSENFLRWEALQSTLLRALSNHNADNWQETGLVQKLTEELKVLSGQAHNLRLDTDSLKRGQGVLDQRLDGLQSEQSRIIQVGQVHYHIFIYIKYTCRDASHSLTYYQICKM